MVTYNDLITCNFIQEQRFDRKTWAEGHLNALFEAKEISFIGAAV